MDAEGERGEGIMQQKYLLGIEGDVERNNQPGGMHLFFAPEVQLTGIRMPGVIHIPMYPHSMAGARRGRLPFHTRALSSI